MDRIRSCPSRPVGFGPQRSTEDRFDFFEFKPPKTDPCGPCDTVDYSNLNWTGAALVCKSLSITIHIRINIQKIKMNTNTVLITIRLPYAIRLHVRWKNREKLKSLTTHWKLLMKFSLFIAPLSSDSLSSNQA
jgi:hypothetical protein